MLSTSFMNCLYLTTSPWKDPILSWQHSPSKRLCNVDFISTIYIQLHEIHHEVVLFRSQQYQLIEISARDEEGPGSMPRIPSKPVLFLYVVKKTQKCISDPLCITLKSIYLNDTCRTHYGNDELLERSENDINALVWRKFWRLYEAGPTFICRKHNGRFCVTSGSRTYIFIRWISCLHSEPNTNIYIFLTDSSFDDFGVLSQESWLRIVHICRPWT